MSSEEEEVCGAGSSGNSYVGCVVESGASVGERSRLGEGRRLAPGLAEGVSEESGPERRASCRERLRMMSDFMEIGRADPCNL